MISNLRFKHYLVWKEYLESQNVQRALDAPCATIHVVSQEEQVWTDRKARPQVIFQREQVLEVAVDVANNETEGRKKENRLLE